MELSDIAVITCIGKGFKMFKEIIDLVKNVKDLLPDGEKKTLIVQRLDEIEKKTKEAEAQIAKNLGYKLCQCTFPPQIMLSIGYQGSSSISSIEKFQCPRCKKIWPITIDPSFLQMKVTDY